jgi:hypothetical protein
MVAGRSLAMTPSFRRLRHVLRHPMLILGAYALRTLAAVGLSWNWAKLLGNANVMAYPKMDSELFAPGAAILLRTIAEQERSISKLAGIDLLLVIGLAIAGCVVTAFAFSAFAENQSSTESIRIRKSLPMAPKMLGISAIYWLSLVAVFLFAKLLYLTILTIIYPIVGERGTDIVILLLAFVVVAAGFIAFVVSDMARAVAVVSRRGPLAAVAYSISCLRRRWGKCLVAAACWTAPCLAGPPILEYILASAGLHGTSKTTTLFLMHQLVALMLCTLHLCWWSKAIDLAYPQLHQTRF